MLRLAFTNDRMFDWCYRRIQIVTPRVWPTPTFVSWNVKTRAKQQHNDILHESNRFPFNLYTILTQWMQRNGTCDKLEQSYLGNKQWNRHIHIGFRFLNKISICKLIFFSRRTRIRHTISVISRQINHMQICLATTQKTFLFVLRTVHTYSVECIYLIFGLAFQFSWLHNNHLSLSNSECRWCACDGSEQAKTNEYPAQREWCAQRFAITKCNEKCVSTEEKKSEKISFAFVFDSHSPNLRDRNRARVSVWQKWEEKK